MIVPPIKLKVNEISIHAKSKKELYRLLQLEGNIYLPPLEQANHKYISDLLSGKKKFLKTTNLKLIQLPHIPWLRITDILSFARLKVDIDKYLPTFKSETKLPERTWTCNIINTLLPLDFKAFVKEKIKVNDSIRIMKRGQEIEVIPELSQLFKESETISRHKGRFAHLLSTKRKRKYEDMEEEKSKITKEEFEKAYKEKDRAIAELKEQVEEYEKLKMCYFKDQSKLHSLFEMGIIDSEGDYIPYKSEDPTEMK